MNARLIRPLTGSRLGSLGPILLLAGAIRLINLRLLGPFVDETGHLYAALHYDFYPLLGRVQHGKVLGYILFYPFAAWASDPVYAARVFIACVGVLTTAGLYLAIERIAGKLAAAFGALVWAVLPYATFHERMALHDPIVTCLAVWSLTVTLGGFAANKRWHAAAGGVLLGLAVLTKVFAMLFALWPIAIGLATWGPEGLRRRWQALVWYLLGILLPLLPLASDIAISILATNPYADQFAGRQGANLVQVLAVNLQKMAWWFDAYVGAPFLLFSAVCIVFAILYPSGLRIALLVCLVVSIGAFPPVLRVMYSRFLVASLVPLVMLLSIVTAEWATRAWNLFATGRLNPRARRRSDNGAKKWMRYPALGLLAISAVLQSLALAGWARFNATMMTQPLGLSLPKDDAGQYLNDWPSGTGFPETIAFFRQVAGRSRQKVLIATGKGASAVFALPVLLGNTENIEVRWSHLDSREEILWLVRESGRRPVYVVLEPPLSTIPTALESLITPRPSLAFEVKRPHTQAPISVYALASNTYLKLPPAAASVSSIQKVAITALRNPNGFDQEHDFFWMGGGLTMIEISAPSATAVSIAGQLYLGPSLPEKRTRTVSVTWRGTGTRFSTTGGALALEVPVVPGVNEILLEVEDRPTLAKLPNGDTRPLLLGVQGLHIANIGAKKPSVTSRPR